MTTDTVNAMLDADGNTNVSTDEPIDLMQSTENNANGNGHAILQKLTGRIITGK